VYVRYSTERAQSTTLVKNVSQHFEQARSAASNKASRQIRQPKLKNQGLVDTFLEGKVELGFTKDSLEAKLNSLEKAVA
jgi:hypothetical protein